MGKEPPVRGSVIQLARRNYLIYTQGYVPFLRQYPSLSAGHRNHISEFPGGGVASFV